MEIQNRSGSRHSENFSTRQLLLVTFGIVWETYECILPSDAERGGLFPGYELCVWHHLKSIQLSGRERLLVSNSAFQPIKSPAGVRHQHKKVQSADIPNRGPVTWNSPLTGKAFLKLRLRYFRLYGQVVFQRILYWSARRICLSDSWFLLVRAKCCVRESCSFYTNSASPSVTWGHFYRATSSNFKAPFYPPPSTYLTNLFQGQLLKNNPA